MLLQEKTTTNDRNELIRYTVVSLQFSLSVCHFRSHYIVGNAYKFLIVLSLLICKR